MTSLPLGSVGPVLSHLPPLRTATAGRDATQRPGHVIGVVRHVRSLPVGCGLWAVSRCNPGLSGAAQVWIAADEVPSTGDIATCQSRPAAPYRSSSMW